MRRHAFELTRAARDALMAIPARLDAPIKAEPHRAYELMDAEIRRVCDELGSTMDLLPTCAKLAAAPLPPRPIDGHDIRPLLFGEPGAKSPWDKAGFCYYYMEQLQAVRSGPWKLYLPLVLRNSD